MVNKPQNAIWAEGEVRRADGAKGSPRSHPGPAHPAEAGKLSLLGEACWKVSSGTSDLLFQRGSWTSTALGWTTGMGVPAPAMGLRVQRPHLWGLLRGVPG